MSHLSAWDVKDAISLHGISIHGISTGPERSGMTLQYCPRCNTSSGPDASRRTKSGYVLYPKLRATLGPTDIADTHMRYPNREEIIRDATDKTT